VQPATATVVVTGNPLRNADPTQPSTTLGGAGLARLLAVQRFGLGSAAADF
jgi:hypothetical protein